MPTMRDPYLVAEEAGDRANTILGATVSRKLVHGPTICTKLQVDCEMYAYVTRTIR